MDAALLLALVTTVAGARLKMLSDAFAFEFGSSRGSREKDTQLADFRQALIDVGKDSRQAATEQQQQSAGIAQQAIKVTDQVVASSRRSPPVRRRRRTWLPACCDGISSAT